MHGKNSPLEDMLLLMDTMHREPYEKAAEEEKRRENEMLVKHEFSAKTDARAKKKNKNLSHVHDMWRGKKKERTAALCAAFFLQDALHQQLKLFKHKLKAS
jgi:hypothetical protein